MLAILPATEREARVWNDAYLRVVWVLLGGLLVDVVLRALLCFLESEEKLIFVIIGIYKQELFRYLLSNGRRLVTIQVGVLVAIVVPQEWWESAKPVLTPKDTSVGRLFVLLVELWPTPL